MTVLKEVLENYLQQCFQAWQKHWNACMRTEYQYFEGDHTI
jgi:hypothetical protein